jgi:hypothetical protein
MLENMTTEEKVIAGITAVGIAALVFHKPTRNAVGLSDGKRKNVAKELPDTNIILKGLGVDSNGNKIAKFEFFDGTKFNIDTNDNIRPLHRAKMSEINFKDLVEIKKEVVRYIQLFGTQKQKTKLKTF